MTLPSSFRAVWRSSSSFVGMSCASNLCVSGVAGCILSLYCFQRLSWLIWEILLPVREWTRELVNLKVTKLAHAKQLEPGASSSNGPTTLGPQCLNAGPHSIEGGAVRPYATGVHCIALQSCRMGPTGLQE